MEAKKTKGKLYPSEREIELYRKRFVEGAQMLGRSGYLSQVDFSNTKIIGTDTEYVHLPKVPVSYYLIERPKLKHLHAFGWNPEDKQHKPILCYLTFKDANDNDITPSEGAILEISARQTPHDNIYKTNKFDIVGVQVDFEMNMFICNLVPHREKQKPINPVPTSQDPINENKWFNREVNYPEELRN